MLPNIFLKYIFQIYILEIANNLNQIGLLVKIFAYIGGKFNFIIITDHKGR